MKGVKIVNLTALTQWDDPGEPVTLEAHCVCENYRISPRWERDSQCTTRPADDENRVQNDAPMTYLSQERGGFLPLITQRLPGGWRVVRWCGGAAINIFYLEEP